MTRRRNPLHRHNCPECGYMTECREDCGVEYGKVGDKRTCPFCEAFPLIDLRPITRESGRYQTVVRLYRDQFYSKRWIIFGQGRLIKVSRAGISQWICDAYLTEGVTDFEHDSAYAISIPLVGVEFQGIYYGCSEFSAIINAQSPDGFNVPCTGYDPMSLPNARTCTSGRCEDDPHIIVPEGHYIPPHNADLFKQVGGRFVQITFGVPKRCSQRKASG